MRLICCDIQGFGKLQQVHLDFRPGLHVELAPNGAGKTTLAVFLKAMLYGMGRGSRSPLSKIERQKYRPWSGGEYGGSLTLELGQKCYRITRSFGQTPAQDRFRLIDLETGRESLDYSPDFGREAFGLDEGAFCRSTYVPQRQERERLSTEQLHRRLTELVLDSRNPYEAAMKQLQARRVEYRHLRGEGGSIPLLRGEVHQTALKLEQAREAQQSVTELEQSLARQGSRRRALSSQLAQLKGERFRLETQGRAEAVRELEQRYPKGFPEELEVMQEARHRQTLLQSRLEVMALEEEALLRLEELTALRSQLSPGALEEARRYEEQLAALEAAPRPSRAPAWVALAASALGAGILLLCTPYLLAALGLSMVGVLMGLCFALRDPGKTLRRTLQASLQALLAPLGPNAGADRLEALEQEYQQLSRRRQAQRELQEKLEAIRLTLEPFCETYCPHGDLDRMVMDRERYRLLGPDPKGEVEALHRQEAAVAAQLEQVEEAILALRQEQQALSRQAQTIPALSGQLEDLRRRLQQQERSCSLLDGTVALLTRARENIAKNYLAPVARRFEYYVNQLGLETGSVRLREDLQPSLEREGEQRDAAWFSAGQADCLKVAMHLALADVLFPGEQPFLVLDDPFVNLDEVHTGKAMALVKQVSETRQVLYLTCHRARGEEASSHPG